MKGIYIDYISERSRKRNIELHDLISNGKVGESLPIYPGIGFKYMFFVCVKIRKNTVNIYRYSKWYWSSARRQEPLVKPVMLANKEGVKFLREDNMYYARKKRYGTDSRAMRGFLSMGLIKNIGIRGMRDNTLVANNDMELATHYPMMISWDGEFLHKIPKAVHKATEVSFKNNRDIINKARRSDYANTRVLRLVRQAEATGDWDKVNPIDVFAVRNVSIRTKLIEHFGMETILDNVDNEVVNEETIDGREYKLLRFQFPDIILRNRRTRTATYLKMINPSTGEVCVEGVPNNPEHTWSNEITMKTVRQALAWRDGDEVTPYEVPVALT